MLVINFSHPLTPAHLARIRELIGREPERISNVKVQFDVAQPFAGQVRDLVDSLGLSPEDWQTLPILVNPPALNTIAVTLLAELHGRMGYFPPVVRVRPIAGSVPPQFEVAEIINLQEVRDEARTRRAKDAGL
jgi:hypothetical protein